MAEKTRDMKKVEWRHYGGRWCLIGQHSHRHVFFTASDDQTTMCVLDRESGRLVPFDPDNEYASRIVACVNACEKIPTETLERLEPDVLATALLTLMYPAAAPQDGGTKDA